MSYNSKFLHRWWNPERCKERRSRSSSYFFPILLGNIAVYLASWFLLQKELLAYSSSEACSTSNLPSIISFSSWHININKPGLHEGPICLLQWKKKRTQIHECQIMNIFIYTTKYTNFPAFTQRDFCQLRQL